MISQIFLKFWPGAGSESKDRYITDGGGQRNLGELNFSPGIDLQVGRKEFAWILTVGCNSLPKAHMQKMRS